MVQEKKHKKEAKDTSDSTKEPAETTSLPSDLKSLVEKNIKWSQVIFEQNKKIKRRLGWMIFGSYFRILVIVVPIILGIVYLPPLLKQAFSKYGSLLGIESGGDLQVSPNLFQGSSLNTVIEQLGGEESIRQLFEKN